MRSPRARSRPSRRARWPLAAATGLLVCTLTASSCSKASVVENRAGSELGDVIRKDPLLDLDVPGAVADEPLIAVGNAETGVNGVPFQAIPTWTVAAPPPDLVAIVLASAVARGLTVSKVLCFSGRNGMVQVVGGKAVGPGRGGVVITVQPLSGAPRTVQLNLTASPSSATFAVAPPASAATTTKPPTSDCPDDVRRQVDGVFPSN